MKWTITYSALIVCLMLPPALTAQVASSAFGGASSSAFGGGGQSNPPVSGANPQSKWNHVELGAYADYFRFGINGSNSNFLGVGARIGVNVQPHVALEGEANYDFARDFTQSVTTSNGVSTTTTVTTSNIRPITALFGPKFQAGTSGPVRLFLTGKVGLIDFSSTNPSGGASTSAAFGTIGGSTTYFAAYPGGGVEFFGGPIGVRIEAGDEMILNNGIYNNLRATIGPTLRF